MTLHPSGCRLAAIVFVVAGTALLSWAWFDGGAFSGPGLAVMLYFLSPYLVPLLLLPFAPLAGAAAGTALGMLASVVWLVWALHTMAKARAGLGAVGLVAAPLVSLAFFMLPGLLLGLFADWHAWRRSR